MSRLTSLRSVFMLGVLGSSFFGCTEAPPGASERGDRSDERASASASTGEPPREGGEPAPEGGSPSEETSTPTPHDGVTSVATDGGSADTRDAGVESSPDASRALPCGVQEILDAHCSLCHGAKPMFGAPVALATALDFQAVGKDGRKLHQVARERVNDADPRKRMPPASAPQPDEGARAKLAAWLEQGANASAETCDSATPDAGMAVPHATEDLDCYRFSAHNGDGKTPYQVGAAADAYINFTFAAPWQGKEAYAVVLRPIVDNAEVIHHYLFYQDNVSGTASGPTSTIGTHAGGTLVQGWAPGIEMLDLRRRGDVGMELSSSSTYSIEIHYNSRDPNAVDASGIEVCIARKKPANIAAVSWLGYDQLVFPATTWVGTCVPTSPQSARILLVGPHMHLQGRHMKSTINRADGTKEILHDAPFDFQDHRVYEKDVMINPGDTITTECTYAQPMAWGLGTDEEMCVLFVYAYPKGVLVDSGLFGAVGNGENACLGQ